MPGARPRVGWFPASRIWLILLCGAIGLAGGCRTGAASRKRGAAASVSQFPPVKGGGVITNPSVIVFWLAATDTLDAAEASGALEDLRYYTARAAPFFEREDIDLLGTHSDTITVEVSGGVRRQIMLNGLDYPYGYVLIDPGYAEQILTGSSTDDELIQAATDYFGLEEGDQPNGTSIGTRD